jgi:hypothetical protein
MFRFQLLIFEIQILELSEALANDFIFCEM